MSVSQAVQEFEMSSRQVTFRFTDGVVYEVECGPEQTLLDAARENDVPVTYQCLSGSCGTCVCKVDEGEVITDSSRTVSLLPSEQKEGLRLSCSAYVTENSVIDLDYPSTFSADHQTHQETATVTDIEWLNDNTVKLSMILPEDSEFEEFEPGQYVLLKAPGTDEWRSYSMLTTVRDLPEIAFYIRVLENGVMSDYLRNRAQIGDEIAVDGAHGVFYLRQDKVPQILIAGGTGLAPILSMLDTLRQKNFKRKPIILAFGCSRKADLFGLDELEMRSDWLANLDVRVCVSEEDADWTGMTCRAHHGITADDISDENTKAYVCGPPAMIEEAKVHLESIGVHPENIHVELFQAS